MTCPDGGCKGHRSFIGGFFDGHVDHLVHTTLSDFPLTIGYANGYERDLDGGTEATYRCVTDADEKPTEPSPAARQAPADE